MCKSGWRACADWPAFLGVSEVTRYVLQAVHLLHTVPTGSTAAWPVGRFGSQLRAS